MEGLYKKAQTLRREQRLLRLIRREESPEEGEFDISTSEGVEILDHLDDVVSRNRLSVQTRTFSFTPQKSGIFFPVAVNIIALAAVLTGIFLFAYFSKAREELIVSGSGAFMTTEGRLIAKIKQEAEEKLSLKDAEIEETRKRLVKIDEERTLLQVEMEDRISEREKELRAQLQVELEEARKELEAGGQSADDIEAQLFQIEAEKTKEFEDQLAAFTKQAEAEAEQRIAEIEKLQNDYETQLRERQTEQLELQEQLKSTEAAQESISENLARLENQRRAEQMLLDQIRTFYEEINYDLANTNYEPALNKLNALKEYITSDSIAALPLMESRSSVELFIIDSLTRLIQLEQEGTGRGAGELQETASQLTTVSAIIEQADTYFRNGDMEMAAQTYIQALREIPDLRRSYDQLQTINELAAKQDRETLDKILAEGNRFFNQENFRGALDKYEQALGFLKTESSSSQALIDKIAQSGYNTLRSVDDDREIEMMKIQLEESRAFIDKMESDLLAANRELENAVEENRLSAAHREALVDHITTIQNRYTDYLVSPQNGQERSQEELFALLQTKLLLKQVLNSESVRSEHPDLYDAVEKYLDSFGADQRVKGEYSSMRDVIAFIDILSNPDIDTNSEPDWYAGSSEMKRALYRDLLEKLKNLIK